MVFADSRSLVIGRSEPVVIADSQSFPGVIAFVLCCRFPWLFPRVSMGVLCQSIIVNSQWSWTAGAIVQSFEAGHCWAGLGAGLDAGLGLIAFLAC